MDSLLANYASSDEEEEQQQQQQQKSNSSSLKPVSSSGKAASSLFSSLPQPKSSPLFSSIPQPKQQQTHKNPIPKTLIANDFDDDEEELKKPISNSNKSSSVFSSLPQPKSQTPQQTLLPLEKSTKRVVQFKPPAPIQSSNSSDEDEDEDEDEEEKERKRRKQAEFSNQSSSVKSFLSSIPAPKSSSTLGVGHSGAGSGRRSVIDTEAPASSLSGFGTEDEADKVQNAVDYANYDVASNQNVVNYANYDHSVENFANYEVGGDQDRVGYDSYQTDIDQNVHSGNPSSYVNYGSYNSYGDHNGYGDHGQYGAASVVQEPDVLTESLVNMKGKRGRKEIPMEIVEVKQDELMKNRPRQDQDKMTGLAFGPAYQPASTKGKPSKLLKRKHQIGSLYFDMKQKEMELAERRAKGFQTKAQTQGKYGW